MNRLPPWFRQDIPGREAFKILDTLASFKINTVCQQAKCPNLGYCFKNGKFTFIILGDTCTRSCSFCNVDKTGRDSLFFDPDEARRISCIVKKFRLGYVIITSVTRDDLSDGGAGQFAKTIEAIRNVGGGIKIEVLIPDFSGKITSLEKIISARPSVLAHNIETVKRLYKTVRPQADYALSLEVLNTAKKINPALPTKSSLMLGMGEEDDEVIEAMRDLRDNRCDILTLGQYLAPSDKHYPVKRFITQEKFDKYAQVGGILGFKAVSSGPLVRSSYQAEKIYREVSNV